MLSKLVTFLLICSASWVVAEPLALPLHIDCGGAGGEIDGKNWISDQAFAEAGTPFTIDETIWAKIPQAPPREVGLTLRHNLHAYNIPLADGDYQLTIHLIEAMGGLRRGFVYEVNGREIVSGVDPGKLAGGILGASALEVGVRVTGGEGLYLQCKGDQVDGDVFETALEVRRRRDGDPPLWEVKSFPDLGRNVGRPEGELATQLRQFCNAEVRILWVQNGRPEDIDLLMRQGTLWGLDTRPGSGKESPTQLLDGRRSFASPFFSPDGSEVVFTDRSAERCYALRWKDGRVRELLRGRALDVQQGKENTWLIYRPFPGSPTRRCLFKDLTKDQVIEDMPFHIEGEQEKWNILAPNNLDVVVKWEPPSGVIELERLNGEKIGPVETTETMLASQVLGFPRISNRRAFLTVVAPIGTPQSEVYIGQLRSSFSGVDRWLQVTDDLIGDAFGDLWLGPPLH